MAFIILDGGGSGRTALVDADNRLETTGVSLEVSEHSVIDGNAFSIDSGIIALTTTASFNGILYLKNTGTVNINLWSIRLCSTVLAQWQSYADPTTGTLISEASALSAINLNTASTQPLAGTIYKATGNGKTVTDGSLRRSRICNLGLTTEEVLQIVSPGKTIAWTCKPSAAADVSLSLIVTSGTLG